MSILAQQLQESIHSPNRQLQQQQHKTFSPRHQLNAKKSIDAVQSEKKHVTVEENKRKQLRSPVIAAEGIQKYKENNSQSLAIVNGLTESQFQEQDNSGNNDYQIYEDGKVNKFFQNENLENPKRISDICLVNDHYILVKMPEHEINPKNYNSLAAAAVRRREFRDMKEHNDKLLKHQDKANRKLCRYLRNKRNRITKITPIHEEPEYLSDDEKKPQSVGQCLKIPSCWQATEQKVETYQTHTKIRKNIRNSDCKEPKNLKQTSSPKHVISSDIHKPRDINTISGSLLKPSPQNVVSLHNYGSLIESESNNDSNTSTVINTPRSSKCPSLENFDWFLRPFRRKCTKTKPKIQAVVYKTYFVKWTRPPDTLTYGYGVKLPKSSHVEVSVLRRCRSAIF